MEGTSRQNARKDEIATLNQRFDPENGSRSLTLYVSIWLSLGFGKTNPRSEKRKLFHDLRWRMRLYITSEFDPGVTRVRPHVLGV